MEVELATPFGVSIERASNQRIRFAVWGRIDAQTIMDFDFHLNDAFDRGAVWILVDLSSVDYVSNVGFMRLLMACAQARKAGGDLVIQGATPEVAEGFRILALDTHLTFVATQEEAWKLLSGESS